jgi:predicted DNA-binding antitoxin AbrB/MazE fold protein
MTTQLQAIFENGVLRPLQPVGLSENQRVTVTISTEARRDEGAADAAHFLLSTERWEEFCDALDAPPRDSPALRKLLTEPSVFDDPGTAAHPPSSAR